MTRTTILFLGLALTAGCGSSSSSDAGTTDTGTTGADAPATDAGTQDAATATDAQAATDVPAGPMGTLMGTAQNYADGTGLAGLTVKSCDAADLACASPFTSTTTNSRGVFTLTYPLTAGNFSGYLQFTGGTANPVTPTRLFVSLNATSTQLFALVPQSTFTGLSGLFSAMFDSTHGAVTFAVQNSAGGVVGAQVSASPSAGQEFYVMGSVPSTSATATDVSGQGGFFSTTPGTYTFTATGPGDAGTLGSQTASVVGGFITAFSL